MYNSTIANVGISAYVDGGEIAMDLDIGFNNGFPVDFNVMGIVECCTVGDVVLCGCFNKGSGHCH